VLRERLEAQQHLNPPKLREHLDAITAIMEKRAAALTQELETARSRIAELEGRLRAPGRSIQDPELQRLARDTIARLGAAARDSRIWPAVWPTLLLAQAREADIDTLREL